MTVLLMRAGFVLRAFGGGGGGGGMSGVEGSKDSRTRCWVLGDKRPNSQL